MVKSGEFGDKDDVRISLLFSAIMIIFIGVAFLFDTINGQLSYGHYSSLEGFLGLLLTGIGIIGLLMTIRWIRKVKRL